MTIEDIAAHVAIKTVEVNFRNRKGHGGTTEVVYRQLSKAELTGIVEAAVTVGLALYLKGRR